MKDGYYDVDYLSEQPAVREDEFLRHVHFEKPLVVKIDGKNNLGIIFKPGFEIIEETIE
jgi:hypothetical protein